MRRGINYKLQLPGTYNHRGVGTLRMLTGDGGIAGTGLSGLARLELSWPGSLREKARFIMPSRRACNYYTFYSCDITNWGVWQLVDILNPGVAGLAFPRSTGTRV